MKKLLSLITIIGFLSSCSLFQDAEPQSYVKIDTVEILNPVLTHSSVSSQGCSSLGSLKLTGTTKEGKPVRLSLVDITNLEGTNTIKKIGTTGCNTWGYLHYGTGTTGDFFFDIPVNTTFEFKKSSNTLNLKKLTLVSISTFNAVGLEVKGSF